MTIAQVINKIKTLGTDGTADLTEVWRAGFEAGAATTSKPLDFDDIELIAAVCGTTTKTQVVNFVRAIERAHRVGLENA